MFQTFHVRLVPFIYTVPNSFWYRRSSYA